MTVFRGWMRDLTYGFLLIPGIVALVFIAVALIVVLVDHALAVAAPFASDTAGARQALASIAGSLITVAGVAFSITIVTLQLVSSQFSPRAVRGFLADRLNQVIAGIFVGTFAYCLLVLGTVRDETADQPQFIPTIGVSLAVLLGIANLGVLLVFIHHMSQSLQVSRIARSVGVSTLDAVQRLYPEHYGREQTERPDEFLANLRANGEPARVCADRPGFVQLIALDDMAGASDRLRRRREELHGDEQLVLYIPVVPGAFVTPETTLLELWPRAAEETMSRWLKRAVRVVDERDIRQDVGYGIRQLVDIALRAISPGINDPTTAITCLGYLRAVTEQLALRDFPAEVRRFSEEGLVVIASGQTFEQLVREAFVEIARYGSSDARVTVAVLSAIEATAVAARRARAGERLAVLSGLAEVVGTPAIERVNTDEERKEIEECVERVRQLAVMS